MLAGEERQDHYDESRHAAHRKIDSSGQQNDQLPHADERQRARQKKQRTDTSFAKELAVDARGVEPERDDQRDQHKRGRIVAREQASKAGCTIVSFGGRAMPSGVGSDRRACYAFFGHFVVLEGPNDAAAGKDQHTVAEPLQFDRVGRKHHHAGAEEAAMSA